jgi:hypothetical protein
LFINIRRIPADPDRPQYPAGLIPNQHPPGAGTTLPCPRLFNAGDKRRALLCVQCQQREPLPRAIAPQALPMAMFGRSRLAPSSLQGDQVAAAVEYRDGQRRGLIPRPR